MIVYDQLPRQPDRTLWGVGTGVGLVTLGCLAWQVAMDPAGWEGSAATVYRCTLWGAALALIAYLWIRGRSSQDDRAALADCLADMLELDIPIGAALRQQVFEFQERWATRYSRTSWALSRMADRVERGSTLAEAVSRESCFPSTWARMLDTAESRGRIVQGLRNLAALERGGAVFTPRLAVRPLFSSVILLAVAGFVSEYIMPTFTSLLGAMHEDAAVRHIQGLTTFEALLSWGALALVASVFSPVRRWVGPALQSLPAVWKLTRLNCQAAVCSSLAGAVEMQLPLEQGLRMAADTVPNATYQTALRDLAQASGDSLACALGRYPTLFSAEVRWLVGQGERFETLPQVLMTAASSLTEQATDVQTRLRTSIEVGLLALVGIGVGYFCLTVMGSIMGIVTTTLANGVLP